MGHGRLIAFGTAMVDTLATVPDDFLSTVPGEKGGTVKITEAQMMDILARLPQPVTVLPGGAAANTAAGVARLLGPDAAGFFACTGQDDAGKHYLDFMRHEGVDVSRCQSTPLAPTGTCLSLVTPDTERTMRSFTGANDLVTPDTFTSSVFCGYTHFFIEGYAFRNPGLGDRLMELAYQSGLSVAIDFNAQEIVSENRGRFRSLLSRFTTAVFANELEARAFAETDDPECALDALAECCPVAIVKLGSRGSLVQIRGQERLRIPSCPVTAIDTTGAGDLWAAGFFAAWLSGKPFREAGMAGARVASEIVQVIGAHLPASTWERLKTELFP